MSDFTNIDRTIETIIYQSYIQGCIQFLSSLLGKNITWKKGKGEKYHLPYKSRLLGRISSGKGTKILGKEIENLKKWGLGRISSCRNFKHPWLYFQVIGAHTDSPVLKVKPVSNKSANGYLQVLLLFTCKLMFIKKNNCTDFGSQVDEEFFNEGLN